MVSVCNEKIKHICYGIPKAELHIHIEGTFEPELVIQLAKKNGNNKFGDVEELRSKYKFTCLADFLDLYYNCCDVLKDEEDFEALMLAYLQKAASQGLKYAEIFFDPQTHTKRGIEFKTVISGLHRGIEKGKELGVEAKLILCFLRDLSEEEALKTFDESLPYLDKFIGIGLDSNEFGNPPEKFINVYKLAKEKGLRLVAHAGEECSIPVDYMYSALDNCKVERIDHGVQVVKCDKLVQRIVDEQIPLTVCPLSNIKLQVFKEMKDSSLKFLMEKGALVMINSDDPAYFGGYIGDNYYQTALGFNFEAKEITKLAINSFKATFLSNKEKEDYIQKVEDFMKQFN